MFGKNIGLKKLAKKAKGGSNGTNGRVPSQHECLLRDRESEAGSSPSTTPTGTFAVYVGEERQRFVVPTGYLSHPLFKMLLEKAYNAFGFDQKSGLVVPCSVTAFQEVVSAVEYCNCKFDFGNLVEEFI